MAKIISLEGIDGSGKTTQFGLLESALAESGSPYQVYKYSSKDNFWGKNIRKIFRPDSKGISRYLSQFRHFQEFMYAMNARSNLDGVDLDAEGVIISDRGIVTAFASHDGKLPRFYVDLLEPHINPDLVLFLEVSPEVGMQRIADREEKFLHENLDEAKRLKDAYMNLIYKDRPKRLQSTEFVVLDGERSIAEVQTDVSSVLNQYALTEQV